MKLWCWLYGHKFPRWSRVDGKYTRVCARCKTVETDMARTPYSRKRAANAADTLQRTDIARDL